MSLIMHSPSGNEDSLIQVKIHPDEVMILASYSNTEVLSVHSGKTNGDYQKGFKEKEFFRRKNKQTNPKL